MPTVNVALDRRSYPVVIGSQLIQQSDLWRQHLPGGKILVVSNDVVAPLYLRQLGSALENTGFQTLVLPDGEATKTIANWSLILDRLVEMKAGRDVCLVALGGGVIGDICGFAAATYMRGVPFIQAPTTLLSQVDASVGGKTAVNHIQGKNLVGAFHQPRAVIADTDTLNTLADREFRAGMAEVVKYGAIRDAAFFSWLESESEMIMARDPAALSSLIEKSVRNKAEVVAEDELESGSRALLNFGHTFGHALETVTAYSRFLHGEAVAIGMLIAARLSESRGLCEQGVSARLAGLLARHGLPVSLPADLATDAIMEAMSLDKKVLGGKTRLVLLTAMGRAIIDSESSVEDIRSALEASR